jgi:hypothetical protein
MRKTTIGLASLLLPTIMGAAAVTACGENGLADPTDPEAICGPCGAVVTGDVGISGNAKLDGFFSAVSDLNKASVSIGADFEANIDELIAVFEVDVAAEADIGAKVDALVAEIEGQVSANASGGLKVIYAGPKCSANISVAVEAQASCEAKADCDVMVDPGEVSVKCEGKCEGSCEGTCSGGFKCDVSAGAACSGKCEGSCTLEAAATCEGTCKGTCSGECSAQDSQGNCAGKCDGMCEGTCELAVAAECSGTCTGSCEVEAEAECEGEAPSCSGSCEGECSGGCTGTATPPSASANCEASAECSGQAKAQASANVECTPPQLEIAFEFTGMAAADLQAQASFSAKMTALQARGVAILQGFAKYEALITGEVGGEVVFDPSPLLVVRGELEAVIEVGVEGDLFADIPIGRIACVIPAMTGSIELLTGIAAEAGATLDAQASFAGALTGGFGG